MTVVADAVTSRHLLDLVDGSLERHHGLQNALVSLAGGHPIKADAQAHHVELILGETRNPSCVEDMTQHLVGESIDDHLATLLEHLDLAHRERVLVRIVGGGEMRKHTPHMNQRVGLDTTDQLGDFLQGESQPVHPGVEFHVDVQGDGDSRDGQGALDEFQIAEAEHLRFQMVFDDVVVAVDLGTHHHDGQVDARAAQLHTLIGKSHGEVVSAMELEDVRHLVVAAAVAKRLHHDHELGLGLDERAVMVEVVDQMIEVDLQHRLVGLLLKLHADLLELECAGTFQQDGLVAELRERITLQEVVDILEEILLHREIALLARDGLSDADERPNTFVLQHLGNRAIKLMLILAALKDIGKDQHLVLVLPLLVHRVEGNGQRVDVGVVIVVDDGAVVDARFDLQPHGDGSQPSKPVRKHVGRHLHKKAHGDAMDGVLDGGLIGKGDGETERRTLIDEGQEGLFILFLDGIDI
mgnify:CR=1 FL=1